MREIVLDTETTGLSPHEGHRIVELGAIELINHLPSGKSLQIYFNPERAMPKEAEAVHGLSDTFLRNQPLFKSKAQEILDFIESDNLIIHNAAFDIGFLNAELKSCEKSELEMIRVIDTLQLARKRHPMGPNSLDALCKRYHIDNSKRTKHGALMDAELLAEVYLELIGGRQTNFGLQSKSTINIEAPNQTPMQSKVRPNRLPKRLTDSDAEKHQTAITELGPQALWKILN